MDALDDPRASANLLIFEIGNSHVCVASSVATSVRTHERFAPDNIEKVVSHARQVWDALPENRLKEIVAAGVVPRVMRSLRAKLAEAFEDSLHVVGEDLLLPIPMAVEAPELVGVDRVCAAAAAYEGVRQACAVASFGTAITIDCVNGEGVFMGGAILPGLAMQAQALAEGTAALPQVEIEPTGEVYGANTRQAISNGVLYGVVGALREITERYATQLGAWPLLIATGGNAELVSKECDFIDRVVPDLCVRGIALAYRRHFSGWQDQP